MNPTCLFISYDGLLDPLGASQILPYLKGIAKHPRKVCILSFEKPEKYRQGTQKLRQELQEMGIIWQPIKFSSRFSYLGKAWDFLKMYAYTAYMIGHYQIKIVHARGHISAQVGLFWKRFFSYRLLFDCRGLWVDEKVDKGGWDLNRYRDAFFYRYFKKKEQNLIQESDHIVVLTQAVIPELKKLGLKNTDKLSVIPCCADFEHFQIASLKDKKNFRQTLLLPKDALVMGYIGSMGKMYMMDKFFKCLSDALQKNPNTYGLIVTPDVCLAHDEMQKYLTLDLQEKVKVQTATREQMPQLIAVMDVMLSFIKPSYARLATSPTKIAESLACGVPVIANEGIGDVTEILTNLQVGKIIKDFSQALDIELMIQNMDALDIRNQAKKVFDLEHAHHFYHEAYQKLQKEIIC